ncbi:hypothetical protein [Nocardioides sediminis]|uniref:hypothetical protein n=1 Tax=Nocardioides sediminis TaxID=433648 RepID=UPI000D317FA4|nr:hypothetical protein [Nocardioides sediminis]
MTTLARLLLVVPAVAAWLVLTAGSASALDQGLTHDQWRTGRLVLGVVGLTFLAFLAYRALRGRLGRRGDR